MASPSTHVRAAPPAPAPLPPADRARAVFDDMVRSGVTPSHATWSALVNAYAESNQPMRAIETLMGMRRRGLAPSIEVGGQASAVVPFQRLCPHRCVLPAGSLSFLIAGPCPFLSGCHPL